MARILVLGPPVGLVVGWLLGFVLLALAAVDEHIPWYLARAAGLSALLLLSLNVCLGLLMSTRLGDALVARWRTFDLHQFTALLALGFLGLHLTALLGDRYIGFEALQLFVPLTSPYRPLATALGILGLYLLLLVIGSSYLRTHIGQRAWRAIHYLAFAAWILTVIHGLLSGSDGATPWARLFYVGLVLPVAALTLWRCSNIRTRQASGPFPSTSS